MEALPVNEKALAGGMTTFHGFRAGSCVGDGPDLYRRPASGTSPRTNADASALRMFVK